MNDQPISLDALPLGRSAIVSRVDGDDAISRRLVALGFWPGASVEVIRRAPFGDPIQVQVAGYRLALRRLEGQRVCLASGAVE